MTSSEHKGELLVDTDCRVTLEYRLETDDGELIEERMGDKCFIFNYGQGETLAAIEAVILGKPAGFTASIGIDANEAYGPYRDDLVVQVDRAELPPQATIEVGVRFKTLGPEGEELVVQIIRVEGSGEDQVITLDGNHPLAGRSLYIDLKVVAVESTPTVVH